MDNLFMKIYLMIYLMEKVLNLMRLWQKKLKIINEINKLFVKMYYVIIFILKI